MKLSDQFKTEWDYTMWQQINQKMINTVGFCLISSHFSVDRKRVSTSWTSNPTALAEKKFEISFRWKCSFPEQKGKSATKSHCVLFAVSAHDSKRGASSFCPKSKGIVVAQSSSVWFGLTSISVYDFQQQMLMGKISWKLPPTCKLLTTLFFYNSNFWL